MEINVDKNIVDHLMIPIETDWFLGKGWKNI